jgi:hypothetical protein
MIIQRKTTHSIAYTIKNNQKHQNKDKKNEQQNIAH